MSIFIWEIAYVYLKFIVRHGLNDEFLIFIFHYIITYCIK